MSTRTLRRCLVLGALSVTLAACGSDDPADSTTADSTTAANSTGTSGAAESEAAPAADEPFGPACSALPAEGEGSVAGMTDDPVATAAGHNPELSTLVQAVTAASLAGSLDNQQEITVLAPANAAFEAVPADARQALLADNARLTSVLLHHVIAGRLAPDQLAGTHTTLNNDEVTIEGDGEMFTVAGEDTLTQTEATVVCGNVQTANATVYIIDQVLAPPGA